MIPIVGQRVDVNGNVGTVTEVYDGLQKFSVKVHGKVMDYGADFYFSDYGEFGLVRPVSNESKMETIINQFRDYQIDWLTGHCDIVCDPETEQVIIQFIKDTTECFIKESE